MPPRTRASAKSDISPVLANSEKDEPNIASKGCPASDGFDLDALDLIQLPEFTDMPATQESSGPFAWSDSAASISAVSPLKHSPVSQDLWQTDDDQDMMLLPLSSPNAKNSQLPDTNKIPSQKPSHYPVVDFSETASTARRSSPFSADSVLKDIWEFDDESETGVYANVEATDKDDDGSELFAAVPGYHLPHDELYDATPVESSATSMKPPPGELIQPSESVLNSSASKASSLQKPRLKTYGSKGAKYTRNTKAPANGTPKVATTADTKSKSATDTKAGTKKSKQRAKSPLKFNEQTQKIKSPEQKSVSKPPPTAKPKPKSKPRKAKAAPVKPKGKIVEKEPLAVEHQVVRQQDQSVGMMTRSRKVPNISSSAQKPKTEMQSDDGNKVQESPKAAMVTSPILLSSSEIDINSDNDSVLFESSMPPYVDDQCPVKASPRGRDSEKTVVGEAWSPSIRDSSAIKYEAIPDTEHEKSRQLIHALSTKPMLSRTLTDSQTLQMRQHNSQRAKANQEFIRRASDRLFTIGDYGSPIRRVPNRKSHDKFDYGIMQEEPTRTRAQGSSVYSSPLFKPSIDACERQPLGEARSIPAKNIWEKQQLVTGTKFRIAQYNTPEPLYKRINGKPRADVADTEADMVNERFEARHRRCAQIESRRFQDDSGKTDNSFTHEIEQVSKDMLSYLSSKESGVLDIAKTYDYNGTRCVRKLVERYDSERDTLVSECKKDCDSFVQQVDRARGAIQDARTQRRLAMEDITNRYKRRRTDSEREVWNAQRLNANVETGAGLSEEKAMY